MTNAPDHSIPVHRRPRIIAVFVIASAVLMTLDLAIKWWAFNRFPDAPVDIAAVLNGQQSPPGDELTLMPRVLSIRLVLNQGAVFGLGQGYTWVFVLITIAAVGVIGYALLTSEIKHRLLHVALALILAGAMGNLYDRIVYSAVRDMLYLFPGARLPFGWHWGDGRGDLYPWVFNVADVYLTLGIGVLVLRMLIGSTSERSRS